MVDKRIFNLQAGGCAVLALAVHELTGWPLVLLCDAGFGAYDTVCAEGEAELPTLPGTPVHVLSAPDVCRVVDACGAHLRADLSWVTPPDVYADRPVLMNVDRGVVEALLARAQFPRRDDDVDMAKAVARAIFELEKEGPDYSSEQIADLFADRPAEAES